MVSCLSLCRGFQMQIYLPKAIGGQVPRVLQTPVRSVKLANPPSPSLVGAASPQQQRPVTSAKAVLLKRDAPISLGNIVTADGTTTLKIASQGNVVVAATSSPKLPNIIRSAQSHGN